jgi:hypothetical protein
MNLKASITLATLMILSPLAGAQDAASCGEQPVEPTIVDGAASTFEQLIANGKEVNAYIAEADQFLDCSEARYIRISGSRIHKDILGEQIKSLTTRHNEIGDELNAQVAAYQAANPQ